MNVYKFYTKTKEENQNEDRTYNIQKIKDAIYYNLSEYDFMCLCGILLLKENPDEVDKKIGRSLQSYFRQYPTEYLA